MDDAAALDAWQPPAGDRPCMRALQCGDPRALSKLRWRCRRGLLENDLLIERFFARTARR